MNTNLTILKPVFIVLPYLHAEKTFNIGGIPFFSKIPNEINQPQIVSGLGEVTKLFWFDEQDPIEDVLFSVVDLAEDKTGKKAPLKQVQEAHTVLTFILLRESWIFQEQASIFLFTPEQILYYKKKLAKSEWKPGYRAIMNWQHQFEVAPGQKILPVFPTPIEHVSQFKQLSNFWDQLEYGDYAHMEGILDLVRGDILQHSEQKELFETLLRAMSWYNKSFSKFTSQEEKLISLAIAFEILYHDEGSRLSISDELKLHLGGIFGNDAQIMKWVDQFYSARSSLVHEGTASQMRFASSGKSGKELLKKPLIHYGQKLLRICIFNMLNASVHYERNNIHSWFIHDNQRLENIIQSMNDSAKTAEVKFQDVVKTIYELEEPAGIFTDQSAIEYKIVNAAGKKLIASYRELVGVDISTVAKIFDEILKTTDQNELVDCYQKLAEILKKDLAMYRDRFYPPGPRAALAYFAGYAGSILFKEIRF